MQNGEVKATETTDIDNFMNVKCQVTAGTDKNTENPVNMRLVTSVDSLNYKEVGFEVFYNGATEPIKVKTSTVYGRIVASDESGVDYNYNPKIISTASEYFVTCTLINIAPGNFDKTFYIKPYCVTPNNETVYGVSRYVKVSDSYNNVINVPVKVTKEQADGMQVVVDDNNKAKLTQDAGYEHDGSYAHLTFKVNDGQVLSSVTKFVFKDASGSEIAKTYHRNPLTKYTGGTTYDKSWYDVNASAMEYVIATSADLYGLVEVAKTYNFHNKTIYLGADITVNEGDATTWNADNAPEYQWATAIGDHSTLYFGGTFDGQNDTISGLYTYTSGQGIGLFGHTNVNAKIRNLRLENSYFETTYSDSNYYASIGSIVGISDKTEMDSVYSNATVVACGKGLGGLIGRATNAGTHTITNSQFDGVIKATNQYLGGIVGVADVCDVSLENCLYSGTIQSQHNTSGIGLGGLVGFSGGEKEVKAKNCLIAGTINTAGKYNVGLVCGTGTFVANLSNVYTYVTYTGVTPSFHPTSKGFGNGANFTLSNENIHELASEEALGISALKLNLDFTDTWVATSNGSPQLKQFATENAIPADTTWYDEASASQEYTITTMEELYGLAALSQSNTFSGWEFTLGKDIMINSGESNKWASVAPKYMWLPIGNLNFTFNGTFNGNGHTIKGVYLHTGLERAGLFGVVGTSCEIKNLSLKNSYLESVFKPTNSSDCAALGSIIGYAAKVNMESVYSDATVVCKTARDIGGLVGIVNDNAAHNMKNCWFEGEVQGYIRVGGLVGRLLTGTMHMTNCLSTGTVISDYASGGVQLGGFCGRLNNSAQITFTDCLNAGEIQVDYGVCVGSYVGWSDAAGQKTTFANSYSIEKFTTPSGVTVGKKVNGVGNNSAGAVEGSLNVLAEDNLQGMNGYYNTKLGFYIEGEEESERDVWVAREGDVPALKQFATGIKFTLPMELRTDTSWYAANTSTKKYTITTKEELAGFSALSQQNTFAGWTITLGADIVYNKDIKNPAYTWLPIGKTGQFSGVFGGADNAEKIYTISGLYVDTNTSNVGLFGNANGTIQNFRLTDSYFKTTFTGTAYTGSIVGFTNGTLHNVYSNATVISDGQESGGLVGRFGGTATKTISNCWFDGTITGSNSHIGGLIGSVNMGVKTISNCLNTGTVISTFSNNNYPHTGGLVGSVWYKQPSGYAVTTLHIENSLNAGKVQTIGTSTVGAIVGRYMCISDTDADTAVYGTVSNVYYTTESYATAVSSNSQGYIVDTTTRIKNELFTGLGEADVTGENAATETTLDFTDVWVTREGKLPAIKALMVAE